MKKIFLVLGLLGFVSVAQAREGAMLAFSGYLYNETTSSSPGSSQDNNTSIYDIKLGYTWASGLYLGGIYTSRNSTDSLISEGSGSEEGVSIGYMANNGFYLMGHYIFSATDGDLSSGSGYQADFGYLGNVTGSFYAGVELTYRNVQYKSVSGESGVTVTVKELFPMLTVAFVF